MNKVITPIVICNEICPKCKKYQALMLEDNKGHRSKNPIYPASSVVCQFCGARFSIHWKIIDEETLPFPGSQRDRKNFEKNIIEYSLSNVRELK